MIPHNRSVGRSVGRVSLARALSKLGYTSRANAAVLIREGRVSVNGAIVRNPTLRCSPGRDRIAVDGRGVAKKRFVYVLMNKPEGVITTRSDERKRATVYDVLGEQGKWLFPVGRLDKETSGLLLLTNDNELGEELTNPLSKVPKTYRLELDRTIADADLALLRTGMVLDGTPLLPAVVARKRGPMLEMTIVQGKNRQIRRMCEQLGYAVVSLMRLRIGRCGLGGLKVGEWRYLTHEEVDALRPGRRPASGPRVTRGASHAGAR